MAEIEFQVLGPLAVHCGPVSVQLPRGHQRAVLATLLLNANRVVTVSELAEVLWANEPPVSARVSVQNYVKRLRKVLGQAGRERISTHPHGYTIRVDADELDVSKFEQLVTSARTAARDGSWEEASRVASAALVMWRGEPLSDVGSQVLTLREVPRLAEIQFQALETRLDAELRLGRHAEVLPELRRLTRAHPLREHFHAQLMLALASGGRRAQALDTYREARRALIGELGVEPGPELRDVHRRILAGDVPETAWAAATAGAAGNAGTAGNAGEARNTRTAERLPAGEAVDATATGAAAESATPRPAQLPADIADFTGREAQVRDVCDALIRREAGGSRGTVHVVVIAGTAGVGKSTLAVHAAHRLRESFPGGQLYANLSGASARPAAPGDVLARFLRDLGVDGGAIPTGEEEQAALYRTRLAGRRVLIVLDDASDAAQVRPLLPGSASCAVVVTTRNRTPDLISTGYLDLDTLPDREALDLFSRIAGAERAAAEPDATAEIIAACAGLPLAIRICAARLATRRQWRIGTMATRLREERHRLDELHAGDLAVKASFQVSYDSLRAGPHHGDPARAFRLLSLGNAQQISLPAAAALAGVGEQDTAAALEALVDANLLQSPEPNRYQLHDLLRLFAAERAQAEETKEDLRTAAGRLLQWYLEMAVAAADLLSPNRYRLPGESPRSTATLNSVPDALAWYDREERNAIAAVQQAAGAGLHDVAWRLATALTPHFFRRETWSDCISANRIAAHSARAAGTLQGEAWALQNLGHALHRRKEVEAFSCLDRALAMRREMNDIAGEAQTLASLATAYYELKGPQDAYDHSLRHLKVLRRSGNPATLGVALSNHGEFCFALGKLDEATECLQEALSIWRAIEGHGIGQVLENIGHIQLRSGRLDEAIASLTEAHRHYQATGHLRVQALVLKHLAEAHRDAGHHDRAHASLVVALKLFEKLNEDEEAEAVRFALLHGSGPAW